jgi:hypothetical protein
MFRSPNQPGQTSPKARSLARKRRRPSRGGCFSPPAFRPRFCRRAPPSKIQIHPSPSHRISKRKPKLLETLQLQQNKPGSGLSIVSAIAEQLIQPGDTNSPALIAKKPIFPPSISTHLPQPTRAPQRGQHRPANRPRIRQTRTKSECGPSFMFRLKGGPTVYFQELTTNFNRTMFRLNRFCSTATPGCVGFRRWQGAARKRGRASYRWFTLRVIEGRPCLP